ncbi:MAG: hypothetical protein KDN19_15920 [Verrucomicrobiae bacterium]|nr:hypothetical protein [Verrucomicrobiae bacterium]
MFQNGQRIVCINDDFEPWVFDLYRALPKRNSIYTVREMKVGRSNPQFVIDDDANLTIGHAEYDILLLLEELHNPDDPHSSIQQELGFRAERFAPLEEDLEEEEAVELVGVGHEQETKILPSGGVGWN